MDILSIDTKLYKCSGRDVISPAVAQRGICSPRKQFFGEKNCAPSIISRNYTK